MNTAAPLRSISNPPCTHPEPTSQPIESNTLTRPETASEAASSSMQYKPVGIVESMAPIVESMAPLEPIETVPDTAVEAHTLLTWPTAEMVAQNVAAFETKGKELQQLEDIITTSRRVAAILFRGPYTLTVYPHDYPFELMKRDADRELAQRAQDEIQRAKIARRKELS